MIDRLIKIKDCIVCSVEQELGNLGEADTKELGEAIDMIKDLEEAIYYHTITKAMHSDEERDWDRSNGKMYYSKETKPNTWQKPMEHESSMPMDMREGRSHMSRKGYIEGKETHQPKDRQMKELEKYMQELTTDLVEMISGTSPEEKSLLQKKISTLAERINQVNV